MDELWTDHVNVFRWTDLGMKTVTGTPSKDFLTVVEAVQCGLTLDEQIQKISASGEYAKTRKIMRCGANVPIRQKDIIQDVATGERFTVLEVHEYKLIPRLKVKMELMA